mmetsp:Transcript_37092/g.80612  ORF Transcript_37092/g.80612 Transcript_37092/m.80612 type:complete len:218 (+) Transcript_37092:1635-2288(+)
MPAVEGNIERLHILLPSWNGENGLDEHGGLPDALHARATQHLELAAVALLVVAYLAHVRSDRIERLAAMQQGSGVGNRWQPAQCGVDGGLVTNRISPPFRLGQPGIVARLQPELPHRFAEDILVLGQGISPKHEPLVAFLILQEKTFQRFIVPSKVFARVLHRFPYRFERGMLSIQSYLDSGRTTVDLQNHMVGSFFNHFEREPTHHARMTKCSSGS